MRGISINDLPERYQDQVRRQLADHTRRIPDAKPESDKSPALVEKGANPRCLVHSDRPLHVRITRVGGRRLDTDNFVGGCKELRDAITSAFGRKGDSEKEGFTWDYVQESKNYY